MIVHSQENKIVKSWVKQISRNKGQQATHGSGSKFKDFHIWFLPTKGNVPPLMLNMEMDKLFPTYKMNEQLGSHMFYL
ncbi:hypothetical protein BDL97_12G104600 [Sphagnum fallax]|nr:hypothetical protein BDL97_12G104600 [Sphagnum fallax]KAH8946609.1 hypothetical protein BDL97_12G104600 [Sphagnum fallax]